MQAETKEVLSNKEAEVFKILTQAAINNRPCPSCDDLKKLDLSNSLVRKLRLKGYIIVTIYNNQERMVKILHGEHSGKSTKKPEGNLTIREVLGTDIAESREFRQPKALTLPAGW